MNNTIPDKIVSAQQVLISSGLTLIFFGVLNLIKTLSPGMKDILTFYSPIGPLLGLYLISILSFLSFRLVLRRVKGQTLNQAFWIYLVAIIIFPLLIFPPIFEPLAHTLSSLSKFLLTSSR